MANNVSKAFDWIANSKEGNEALDQIHKVGELIREQFPGELNNAELKYLMERLWAQRGLEGWNEEFNFNVQPSSDDKSVLDRIELPDALNNELRIRNRAFVVKASIPQANF